MRRTSLHINVTGWHLSMGFSFYPLRRLKLFASQCSRQSDYLRSLGFFSSTFHLFLRSFILRGWEHRLHAARSVRLVEIFLLLDLRTFSFPQHLKFPFFSRSPLLAITFQFEAIPRERLDT